MGEFDLIRHYFTRPTRQAVLGVGDDCALLQPADGMQIAISTDMLVEGRHFFADVDPRTLGHKSLAVNLSDLAACGARPLAFTLALSLPRIDAAWLQAFSDGMWALADAHGCELVGGDTTQGPLNICITVFGEVPRGKALLRSGAQVGDDIWVSGSLGDARLALAALKGSVTLSPDLMATARERLEQPSPRIRLGLALRGIANAAIDLSDGLAGDLLHVLSASHVGACINVDNAINLIAHSANAAWSAGLIDHKNRLECVFSGGDDYELAFTAPASARQAVLQASEDSRTRVSHIGSIEAQPGLRLVDASGTPVAHPFKSFTHFA